MNMDAVIYYTEIPEKYAGKRMEHMIGEKLLEAGIKQEYGLDLAFEPRGTGEHGKPFFTLRPSIHYNISHSGKYVLCILTGQPVGIDIQEHKDANYESMLRRMVPLNMIDDIMRAGNVQEAFFTQWVLREAYIKWTGEGLSCDLRNINMDEGFYTLFDMEPGYSGAVWAAGALELTWKKVEIELP